MFSTLFCVSWYLQHILKNFNLYIRNFKQGGWQGFFAYFVALMFPNIGILTWTVCIMVLFFRFLLFEFLLPAIQITLFCLCIGREPYNLHMCVVNNETCVSNTTGICGSVDFINRMDNRTFTLVSISSRSKVFK